MVMIVKFWFGEYCFVVNGIVVIVMFNLGFE